MAYKKSKSWSIKPCPATNRNYGHPLANGLVGHWLFNEGAGNKVYNLVGVAKGTFSATPPTWSPKSRTNGSSLYFLEASSNSIVIDKNRAFDFSTGWTLSAWANTTTYDDMSIFWKNYANQTSPNYGNMYALDIINGYAAVRYVNTSRTFYSLGGTTAVINGMWHLITGVFSSFDNTLRIYVDGKEDNTAAATTGTQLTADTNLYIAERSPGYSTTRYTGNLEDLRAYNRPLTAREVRLLYENPFADLITPTIYPGIDIPVAGGATLKTKNGLALASIKTFNNLAKASVKTVNTLTTS